MILFEKRRISGLALQLGAGVLAATLLFFPIMALAEYWLYLTPVVKSIFVFGYILLIVSLLAFYIIRPWWKLQKTHSLHQYEQLSRQVSGQVASLDDKLINYIQMLGLSAKSDNALVAYSLGQKQEVISRINIPAQVSIKIPAGLLKRLLLLAALGLAVFVGFFDFVREGSSRLMHVGQAYAPPAPFAISVGNFPTQILANKPLEVKAQVTGPAMPEQLFVQVGSRTLKMESSKGGLFSQTIDNLEIGTYPVQVFAGNIVAQAHAVEVVAPGQIEQLRIRVVPPAYTRKASELLENEGNVEVPKGSSIEWNIEADHLTSLSFVFGKNAAVAFAKSGDKAFSHARKIMESAPYEIKGINTIGQPDQQLNYNIQVVDDAFPKIQVSTFQDSLSLSKQYFAGRIADDYGFTQLRAQIQDPQSKKVLAEAPIAISRSEKNQTFVFVPEGKLATIMAEKSVLLTFKVWDNDGVSGPKATLSQTFDVKEASRNMVAETVDKLQAKNEEKLDDLVKKTEAMEKNSKKMLESLKGKKELNWQDKKELQNFVEKQKDLFKQIDDLKNEAEKVLKNKQENQLQSQELLEKNEQINKMLEELLDEKTKEMLKELERLMEQQNQNKDQLQDAFEKMQDKNEFIQNELDRAMEMLKQLKVEEKLEKAINDLDKLAEKEEKAGEKNEKEGNNQSPEQKQDAQKEQKEMNDMFKQVKEDIKQMQEINQQMEDKNNIDTGEEEQKEAEQSQQESMQQMQQNKMQKAGNQQKKGCL